VSAADGAGAPGAPPPVAGVGEAWVAGGPRPAPVASPLDDGHAPIFTVGQVASMLDDWHAPIFTVGQVASMLQVQPAFLRRLDAEQVVTPARSGGGQRRYSRVEIDRVAQVASLASEGLTLAGIRRLMVLEREVADLRRELAEARARRPPGQAVPDS